MRLRAGPSVHLLQWRDFGESRQTDVRIHRGGVAAFDYDLDGWCDLYFTQGTTRPPDTADSQFLDALFRNVAGIRMCEVSHLAGIHDAGFAGVAAGDFDNDGFPDLYVANIDGNRLYKTRVMARSSTRPPAQAGPLFPLDDLLSAR